MFLCTTAVTGCPWWNADFLCDRVQIPDKKEHPVDAFLPAHMETLPITVAVQVYEKVFELVPSFVAACA